MLLLILNHILFLFSMSHAVISYIILMAVSVVIYSILRVVISCWDFCLLFVLPYVDNQNKFSICDENTF